MRTHRLALLIALVCGAGCQDQRARAAAPDAGALDRLTQAAAQPQAATMSHEHVCRAGAMVKPGRLLALALLMLPAAPAAARAPAFSLEEATVAELQEAMQAGRLTARRLVELYLARIAALDRR